MGIREWANNHPKVATGALGLCILTCTGGIVAEVLGSRHTIKPVMLRYDFSVDDGKTFFEAPQTNIPPFDYQGQTAVLAHVFSCGGRTFVGYLERYTETARKVVLAGGSVPLSVEHTGREFKKPGDLKWINASDMFGVAKVVNVTSPDGTDEKPIPLEP